MTDSLSTETPHPDDFVTVELTLKFRAKLNPQVKDTPPPVPANVGFLLPAAHAAEDLERVLAAIRERRVYGLMMQELVEGPVSAGEWLVMSEEEFASLSAKWERGSDAS